MTKQTVWVLPPGAVLAAPKKRRSTTATSAVSPPPAVWGVFQSFCGFQSVGFKPELTGSSRGGESRQGKNHFLHNQIHPSLCFRRNLAPQTPEPLVSSVHVLLCFSMLALALKVSLRSALSPLPSSSPPMTVATPSLPSPGSTVLSPTAASELAAASAAVATQDHRRATSTPMVCACGDLESLE